MAKTSNKFEKRVKQLKAQKGTKFERKIEFSDTLVDLPTETRLSVLTTMILSTNNTLRSGFMTKVKQHENIKEACLKLRKRLVTIKEKEAIKILDKFDEVVDVHQQLIQKQFTQLMRTHKLLSNELKNLVMVIYGKEKIEKIEEKVVEDIKKEVDKT